MHLMAKRWMNDTYHYVEGKPRMLPQYNQWFDMKQRCTSSRSQSVRPQYIGCTLVEDWRSYDRYLEWAQKQIGFLELDDEQNIFQLDKDLLGSLLYSPETCVFLPQQINKFLTGSRGNQYVGCSLMKSGKWRVTIRDPFLKKNVHLGCFGDVHEASREHTKAKQAFAAELAEIWKDRIDPRAYEKLVKMC